MQEHLTSIDFEEKAYGVQYMKQNLQDHFKDIILFTDIAEKKNVVTFRTTASSILHDYNIHEKNACEDTEAVRLIEAAAKLITNDIKAIEEDEDYPHLQDYSTETVMSFLADSLKSFLKKLIVGTNKENNEKSRHHLSRL